MSWTRTLRSVALITALALVLLFAVAYVAYRVEIRQARARISSVSQLIDTPCGPIEYASAGQGRPILAVHGAGGGFDQGLEIASPLVERGFRVIAMSRFGYLRTPLPADASPAAQADAHACLLDALHIQRVAVVGASAGAPSSMQFVLRHPDRAAALVLLVPAAYPAHIERRMQGATPEETSHTTTWVFNAALKSDFLFWLAPKVAPGAMTRAVLGTPPADVKSASADERARVMRVMDHVMPMSARRLGLLNDAAIVPALPRYELERITAPTLIIGVQDCLYGTYDGARYSAEHIPGARFISFPTGGHLWVGHQNEVVTEISRFLSNVF